MDKKKVLILSYSNLTSDPRIQKQINALKNDYYVETSGYIGCGQPDIPFYPIYQEPPFSLLRKLKRAFFFYSHQFNRYYWDTFKQGLAKRLQPNEYDVVISNDIQTLPLATAIAVKKTKIYFDSHEYHPKEFNENLNWRLFYKPFVKYLCKTYIPKTHAFSTVAEKIAEEYKKFIGIKPEVITNATLYRELLPSPINPSEIKLIHHGTAAPSRKLEEMIKMMDLLDERFSLCFMLTGTNTTYFENLKKLAKKNKRIHFKTPVPSAKIVEEINQYDLGIYILAPTNFNNEHALPNKFFEFVQARLGIIISPNPEMARLVTTHQLGLVSKDYTAVSMADLLNKLTIEEIKAFKENANAAAKILTAEENIKKIHKIVSDLL